MTSQDYFLLSQKKEDTNTNADRKCEQKNETQRLYHQKNLKNINAQHRASYNRKLFEAKHKHQEMNTEKEKSFPDAPKKTNLA